MTRRIILLVILLVILIPILHASNNIMVTATNTSYWELITYYPDSVYDTFNYPITFHNDMVGNSIPIDLSVLNPLGATPYYYYSLTTLNTFNTVNATLPPGTPPNPISIFEQSGAELFGVDYSFDQIEHIIRPSNMSISLPIPVQNGFILLTTNKSYYLSSSSLLSGFNSTLIPATPPSAGFNGLFAINNQYYGFFYIRWLQNNSLAIINRLNGSEIIFTPPPHTQANPIMFIPGQGFLIQALQLQGYYDGGAPVGPDTTYIFKQIGPGGMHYYFQYDFYGIDQANYFIVPWNGSVTQLNLTGPFAYTPLDGVYEYISPNGTIYSFELITAGTIYQPMVNNHTYYSYHDGFDYVAADELYYGVTYLLPNSLLPPPGVYDGVYYSTSPVFNYSAEIFSRYYDQYMPPQYISQPSSNFLITVPSYTFAILSYDPSTHVLSYRGPEFPKTWLYMTNYTITGNGVTMVFDTLPQIPYFLIGSPLMVISATMPYAGREYPVYVSGHGWLEWVSPGEEVIPTISPVNSMYNGAINSRLGYIHGNQYTQYFGPQVVPFFGLVINLVKDLAIPAPYYLPFIGSLSPGSISDPISVYTDGYMVYNASSIAPLLEANGTLSLFGQLQLNALSGGNVNTENVLGGVCRAGINQLTLNITNLYAPPIDYTPYWASGVTTNSPQPLATGFVAPQLAKVINLFTQGSSKTSIIVTISHAMSGNSVEKVSITGATNLTYALLGSAPGEVSALSIAYPLPQPVPLSSFIQTAGQVNYTGGISIATFTRPIPLPGGSEVLVNFTLYRSMETVMNNLMTSTGTYQASQNNAPVNVYQVNYFLAVSPQELYSLMNSTSPTPSYLNPTGLMSLSLQEPSGVYTIYASPIVTLSPITVQNQLVPVTPLLESNTTFGEGVAQSLNITLLDDAYMYNTTMVRLISGAAPTLYDYENTYSGLYLFFDRLSTFFNRFGLSFLAKPPETPASILGNPNNNPQYMSKVEEIANQYTQYIDNIFSNYESNSEFKSLVDNLFQQLIQENPTEGQSAYDAFQAMLGWFQTNPGSFDTWFKLALMNTIPSDVVQGYYGTTPTDVIDPIMAISRGIAVTQELTGSALTVSDYYNAMNVIQGTIQELESMGYSPDSAMIQAVLRQFPNILKSVNEMDIETIYGEYPTIQTVSPAPTTAPNGQQLPNSQLDYATANAINDQLQNLYNDLANAQQELSSTQVPSGNSITQVDQAIIRNLEAEAPEYSTSITSSPAFKLLQFLAGVGDNVEETAESNAPLVSSPNPATQQQYAEAMSNAVSETVVETSTNTAPLSSVMNQAVVETTAPAGTSIHPYGVWEDNGYYWSMDGNGQYYYWDGENWVPYMEGVIGDQVSSIDTALDTAGELTGASLALTYLNAVKSVISTMRIISTVSVPAGETGLSIGTGLLAGAAGVVAGLTSYLGFYTLGGAIAYHLYGIGTGFTVNGSTLFYPVFIDTQTQTPVIIVPNQFWADVLTGNAQGLESLGVPQKLAQQLASYNQSINSIATLGRGTPIVIVMKYNFIRSENGYGLLINFTQLEQVLPSSINLNDLELIGFNTLSVSTGVFMPKWYQALNLKTIYPFKLSLSQTMYSLLVQTQAFNTSNPQVMAQFLLNATATVNGITYRFTRVVSGGTSNNGWAMGVMSLPGTSQFPIFNAPPVYYTGWLNTSLTYYCPGIPSFIDSIEMYRFVAPQFNNVENTLNSLLNKIMPGPVYPIAQVRNATFSISEVGNQSLLGAVVGSNSIYYLGYYYHINTYNIINTPGLNFIWRLENGSGYPALLPILPQNYVTVYRNITLNGTTYTVFSYKPVPENYGALTALLHYSSSPFITYLKQAILVMQAYTTTNTSNIYGINYNMNSTLLSQVNPLSPGNLAFGKYVMFIGTQTLMPGPLLTPITFNAPVGTGTSNTVITSLNYVNIGLPDTFTLSYNISLSITPLLTSSQRSTKIEWLNVGNIIGSTVINAPANYVGNYPVNIENLLSGLCNYIRSTNSDYLLRIEAQDAITNTTQPFYILLGLGHAFGVTYESLGLICRKAETGLYLNITAFNEETGQPVPSNITLVTNTNPIQVIGEKTGAYAVFNITKQYYDDLIANYYAYITPLNSTQGGLVIYPISLNSLSQEGTANNGSQVISIPVSINPSNVKLNLLTVNTVYSSGAPALSNITISGPGFDNTFIETASVSVNLTSGTYLVKASTTCNSTILSKSTTVTMNGEPETVTITFPCNIIVGTGRYIVKFKANTTSGSPVYPVTLRLSSSNGLNRVINLGINGAVQVLQPGLTYTWTLLSWNPAYTPEVTGSSFTLTQNNTIIYILFTKSGSSVYDVFAHVYYRYPNGSLIPIPHAKVTVANLSTSITTFTDSSGEAIVGGLSPGLYNVSATALNYTSVSTITKSVTVTQNESVDFFFTPPPAQPKQYYVTIHVVNGTGYGLNANVFIYFSNGSLVESLTALNGYAYAYLEQGTYTFKASFNGVSNETTQFINSNATVLIVLPTSQPAPSSSKYYPLNITAILVRNNVISRMNVVIDFSMSNNTIVNIVVNGSRVVYLNGGLSVSWKLASWSPSYDIPLQTTGSFTVTGAGQLMLYFTPPPIYALTVKVLSLQGQAIPGASVLITNSSTKINMLTDANGEAVVNLQGLEHYNITATYLGVSNATSIYLASNTTVTLYLNTTKISTSTTTYYPLTFTSQVYLANEVVGEMSSMLISVSVSNGTKVNITANPSATIYVLGNQTVSYALLKFSPNWFKPLTTTGSLKVLGATTVKLSFLEEFLSHTYFISELTNGTLINGVKVRISMPTGFNATYSSTILNITTPYILTAYQGLEGSYTVLNAGSYTVLNPTGQFMTINGSVIIYLSLKSSSKETDVIVRVVNPVNEPVPNATVTAGTGFTGKTGANGEVSFLAPTGVPVMINATYGKARNSTIITPVGSSYMVTLTLNVNESTPTTLGKQGILWVYAYDALNNSLIKAPIQVQVILRNGFGSVVGMNYTINGVATLLYTLYNYYNITGYLKGWTQVNNGYVYLYQPESVFNLIMAPDTSMTPPSGNNTLPTLISNGVTYYPLTFLVITRDGFPVQGANVTLTVNGARYVRFTDSSGEATFYFPQGSSISAIVSVNKTTLYDRSFMLLNGTLIIITANNYSIFYYPFTIIQSIQVAGGPVVFTGLRLNPVLTTLSIWSNVVVNDSILMNETLNSSTITQLKLKLPLSGNGLQSFSLELPVLVIGNGTLRDVAIINETISTSGNKTLIDAVNFYRNPVQSNALNVSGFMTIATQQTWTPINEIHPPFTLPGDVGLYSLKLIAPPGEIQLIKNSTFSGYLDVPVTVADILTLPWDMQELAGYYSKVLKIGNTTSALLLTATLGWGVAESYSPILPPGLITLSTTSPLTIPIDPAVRLLTLKAPGNAVSGLPFPVDIILMTNIYGNTITILGPLLKYGGVTFYAGNKTTIYSIKTQGIVNVPWYIFMEKVNLTASAPQSAYPPWGIMSVEVTVFNFFLVIILLIILVIIIAGVSVKAIHHAKHEVLGANRFVKRNIYKTQNSLDMPSRFVKRNEDKEEGKKEDKHKSRFLKRGNMRLIVLFLLGLALFGLGIMIAHASTLPIITNGTVSGPFNATTITVNGTTYYILYIPNYPPTQTYLNLLQTYLENKTYYPDVFVNKSQIYPGVLVYVPPQFLNPAFDAIDYYTDVLLAYNDTTAINKTSTGINTSWIQQYLGNMTWDVNEQSAPGVASNYSEWFNLTIIYPYANPLYFIPNSYFMYSLDVSGDTGWLEPVTIYDRVGPFIAYAEVTLITPSGNYTSTATIKGNKTTVTQDLTIDFQNDADTGESPIRFNQGYHVNMTVVAVIHAKLTLTNATIHHVAGVAVSSPGWQPGVEGFNYYSFNFFIVPNVTCFLTPNGNMIGYQKGEGPSEYCITSNITFPVSDGKYFLWGSWGGGSIYDYMPYSLLGQWVSDHIVKGVPDIFNYFFAFTDYAYEGVQPYFNGSTLVAWSYNYYVPREWSGSPINDGGESFPTSTGYNVYDTMYSYIVANATTNRFHELTNPIYLFNINGYTGSDPIISSGKGLFGFLPLLDTSIIHYITFKNLRPISGLSSPLIKGLYYYFISNMSNFKQFYVVEYNYSASELMLNGSWYVLGVIPPQFNMTSAITYLKYNTNKTFYNEYYYQAYNAHGYLAPFIINNTIINHRVELTSKLNLSSFFQSSEITPLMETIYLYNSANLVDKVGFVLLNGSMYEINGSRTFKGIYLPSLTITIYLPINASMGSYSLYAYSLYFTRTNELLHTIYAPISYTINTNYTFIVEKKLYYISSLTLNTTELEQDYAYLLPEVLLYKHVSINYINSTAINVTGTIFNHTQFGQIQVSGIYSLQENGETYYINGTSMNYTAGNMIINYTNAVCLTANNPYSYYSANDLTQTIFIVNGTVYGTGSLCFSDGTYNITIYMLGYNNKYMFSLTRILLRHVNSTLSPIITNSSPINGFNYAVANAFTAPINSTTLYAVLEPNYPSLLLNSSLFVWRNDSLINATLYLNGVVLKRLSNVPVVFVSVNTALINPNIESYMLIINSGSKTLRIIIESPSLTLYASGLHNIVKPDIPATLLPFVKYVILTSQMPPKALNSDLILIPSNVYDVLSNFMFGNFSLNLLNTTQYLIPLNAYVRSISSNNVLVRIPPIRVNATLRAVAISQHQVRIIVHTFYYNVSLSLPVTIIVNTPSGGVASTKNTNATGYAVFLVTLPNSISLESVGSLSISLYIPGTNYTQPLQEQESVLIQYEPSTYTYPTPSSNYVITQVSSIPIIGATAIALSLILILRRGVRKSRFNKRRKKKEKRF